MAREADGQLVGIGRARLPDRRGSGTGACVPARRSARATAAARGSRTSRNAPRRRMRPAASKCPARCSSSAGAARAFCPGPQPWSSQTYSSTGSSAGMRVHRPQHEPGKQPGRRHRPSTTHGRNYPLQRIAASSLLPQRTDAYYKQRSRRTAIVTGSRNVANIGWAWKAIVAVLVSLPLPVLGDSPNVTTLAPGAPVRIEKLTGAIVSARRSWTARSTLPP